jgi:hypothetical protein
MENEQNTSKINFNEKIKNSKSKEIIEMINK